MGRGHAPAVSREVIEAIINVKALYPDKTARGIHDYLNQNMGTKHRIPHQRTIHDKLIQNSEEIQRRHDRLSKRNGKLWKMSEIDKHWHSGTLGKYPLSPSAVAKIFQILAEDSYTTLTIREAQWLDRLSALTSIPPKMILWHARLFANAEWVSDLVGTSSDNTKRDRECAKILEAQSKSGGIVDGEYPIY